jgi:predicted nuclease with RNAse H fold
VSRRALGIDVSFSRGLDAVVLDETGELVLEPRNTNAAGLRTLVEEVQPDIVAIDSPPEWAREGRSRLIERQLQALGIHIYACPADPGDHKFYRWMRVGFEAFWAVADAGYSLYRGGPIAARQAIEVFPHASAVVLRGSLPARGVRKLEWRGRVLREAGIPTDSLRTVDQIDAALAALTGLRCLEGDFCTVGEENHAVLVLPIPQLPGQRYVRDPSAAPSIKKVSDQPRPTGDRPLHSCLCGCGQLVARRYVPGHDARHRSMLLKRMRAGDADALQQLTELGWMPLPEPLGQRYVRDPSAAPSIKKVTDQPHPTGNRPLHPCLCGCGQLVARRYAPGHDARHRSTLLKRMRASDADALQQLTELGWMPQGS